MWVCELVRRAHVERIDAEPVSAQECWYQTAIAWTVDAVWSKRESEKHVAVVRRDDVLLGGCLRRRVVDRGPWSGRVSSPLTMSAPEKTTLASSSTYTKRDTPCIEAERRRLLVPPTLTASISSRPRVNVCVDHGRRVEDDIDSLARGVNCGEVANVDGDEFDVVLGERGRAHRATEPRHHERPAGRRATNRASRLRPSPAISSCAPLAADDAQLA